jgi:adenylate cyclase
MARLILATAEGQQAIELRPINSLGRHPNNSIQLLDKIVSKEHCIVEQRDGMFILRDLGSLNGTYINGERVRGEQMLRHGDEIALGSTRARYDDGSGAPVYGPSMLSPGAIQQPLPQQPPMPQPAGPPPPQWPQQQVPASMMVQQGQAPQAPQPPPIPMMNPAGPPSMQRPGMPPQPPPIPQMPNLGPPAYPPGPAPVTAPLGSQYNPYAPPQPAAQRPPRPPSFSGTRVDLLDSARAIGTQIAAQTKGFVPFDEVARDPQQLRLDYERLRNSWELTRDIGLERDFDKLLEKILMALFKFVKADRGVILLRDETGALQPRAARRRDGTDTPIQVSTTILNHVMKERAAVLTHDASMDFAASKGKSMILNRISSAIVVPLLHDKDVLGALWLDSETLAQFQQKDLEMITAVANQATMFIENNLLAKKVEQEIVTRERFSRLLSPNVAEQVISGKLEVKLGGASLNDVTVFNSDIRGFTRMSEGTTPEVMIEMLNEYFEMMVETIFRYDGTLDKFMGDGIMAIWGAPAQHGDDPIRCVQSSLEQMDVLGRYNRARVERGEAPLAIGIGIHTGPLVAGYVGSSRALSYTVIGDTANTSARLCGIALAGQIVISENTLNKLGNRFEVEELPPAGLKGKEKPLRIFNVKREKPSASNIANFGR